MSLADVLLRAADLIDPRPPASDADRARWRNDPVAFMVERLGMHLTADQVAVVESVRDNHTTLVKAGNGTGKTYLVSGIVAWIMECFDGAQVLTTAPNAAQIRDLTWKEIRSRHATATPPLTGNLLPKDPRWDISHDHFAVGKTSDSEEGLKGLHAENLAVVGEEASGLARFVFTAFDQMTIGDGFQRQLFVSNPVSLVGGFYDRCQNPGPFAKVITMSARNHPNIVAALEQSGLTWDEYEQYPGNAVELLPEGWRAPIPGAISLRVLEERRHKHGIRSIEWIAHTLGEFPDDAENGVIRRSALMACRTLGHPAGTPVVAGVDVADSTDGDETVVVVRAGTKIVATHRWRTDDPKERVRLIADALVEHRVTTVRVDAIGVGSQLVAHLDDILRRRGHECRVFGVKVSEKSADPNQFANLRAELWWHLRELVEERVIDVADLPEDALAQLCGVQYYTPGGRIRIELKADTRTRLGQSPDIADALVLACIGTARTVTDVSPPRPTATRIGPALTRGLMTRKL